MPATNSIGINQTLLQEKITEIENIKTAVTAIPKNSDGLNQLTFGSGGTQTSTGTAADNMGELNQALVQITTDLGTLMQKTIHFLKNVSENYDELDNDIAAKVNE